MRAASASASDRAVNTTVSELFPAVTVSMSIWFGARPSSDARSLTNAPGSAAHAVALPCTLSQPAPLNTNCASMKTLPQVGEF